jgi:hypothetical protein
MKDLGKIMMMRSLFLALIVYQGLGVPLSHLRGHSTQDYTCPSTEELTTKYDGWVRTARLAINEPAEAMRDLRSESSRNAVLLRNKEINKAYARMFLKNPDVYMWSGMASLASSKVGHTMELVKQIWVVIEASNQISCLGWDACADFREDVQNWAIGKMGLPTAEEMWQMLRKGNRMIFEDIYWSWVAYDAGEFDNLICVLEKDIHRSTDSASKAKTIAGWKQLKAGHDNGNNFEEIFEGNLKLLWHEQHSAQTWFYSAMEVKIGNLAEHIERLRTASGNVLPDLLVPDRIEVPIETAVRNLMQSLGRMAAELFASPIKGGKNIFESCHSTGRSANVANWGQRWHWIMGTGGCTDAPMGPTWKSRLQTKMPEVKSDMTTCLSTGFSI